MFRELRRRCIVLILVAGVLGCPPVTTTPDAASDAGVDAGLVPDDLATTLEPIWQSHDVPALGAAVFRADELVAIGVAGVRKQGDPTPASVQDKWHLGSDTKAMAATLIGLYVDRDQIHFADTIATLFAGETIDPGYGDVTLEQLLQHRGGAPGTMPSDIWSQMWADGAAPDARITAVRSLLARAPAQAPGTFVYSNAGYMIAGAALERVTSATWESLMTSELFTPLAMPSCGFGAPGTPDQVDQPWGHAIANNVLTPQAPGPTADNPPSLGPAGTVHCSLADWGKFLSLHLAGARGEPNALAISNATMTRLQTPPTGGDYACGWGVGAPSWAGGTALSHSGSNTMWFVTALLAPAKNIALAVVTNRGDTVATSAVNATFDPLIELYLP